MSVAAHSPALELLFDALPSEDAVYWATPDETVIGLGAACVRQARGADRFAALRDVPARAFAGFSFTPGAGGLGDARAIVPRVLVRRTSAGTTVSGDVPAVATRPLPSPVEIVESRSECDAFVALVDRARAAISDGVLEKVVVHRQTRLPACARSAGQVLEQLAHDQPTATRFAFRSDGRTFLGATPERLVRVASGVVQADVLAGSSPSSEPASSLLSSEKDRAEHEHTRRAIVAALGPFCTTIHEDGPHVRSLPHLHHLHTSLRGTLASKHHVLDLVAALHPTPAVGGVPRDRALAFIATEEHLQRGWYASPVGWFTPDGDGDFAVALRCALLEPDTTTLYAGAGIVSASDAQRELAETTSKRRAIASALGYVIE